MAVQITSYGVNYPLEPDYTLDEVEARITKAISKGTVAVTFRGRAGDVLVFSIGGAAPLAISEYDPDVIVL